MDTRLNPTIVHTEQPLAPVWRNAFLAALRETGIVRDACEAVGIHRSTAYDLREADPVFAEAWRVAIQDAADLLEREAVRRARLGVREPVIYQGQLSGIWVDQGGDRVADGTPGAKFVPLTVTRYSDGLLMFLMKGIRPDKFRDNHHVQVGGDPNNPLKHEHAGPGGVPIRVDYRELSDDDLDRRIGELESRAAEEGGTPPADGNGPVGGRTEPPAGGEGAEPPR